ncbi:hypothetical protein M8C21_017378 [Ambrosia artemisiifolia]|uniref:Uncharacterized protein n=1 Tax=Ambrosia artemisiifolia TaxID=4212 RepID=A0AAD5DDZ9_AMBAR|nr:hypothetical protein M8C21_017378 [Ambrosia artemisiifolia]
MYNKSMIQSTWTRHEEWLFVNAVAKFSYDICGQWQELANAIPGKTAEEVKAYYMALEHDLLEIEAGRVELPHYPDDDIRGKFVAKTDAGLISSKSRVKERKKATPWTVEEHKIFLHGLEVYGKGDWRSISRMMVVTRTATQVASHAQKYFLRQASKKEEDNNNNKKKKKRRCSIHDITTADAAVVVQAEPCLSTPPTTSLNGGQESVAVAPQPVTSFYDGPVGGRAPPQYEFMGFEDEEFGIEISSYLSEAIFE